MKLPNIYTFKKVATIKFLFFLWATFMGSSIISSVQAQSSSAYPTQSIRFVVPYSPGGLPDTVARQLSVQLGQRLGQSILVENKPGAGGIIAAQYVKSSPHDGYTFLVTDTMSITTSTMVSPLATINPRKDFLPAALVARAPNFLAISPNIPANNISEFAAYVRSKPGLLNYGSSGIGSPHHLAMEALKQSLNLDMVHVPFKGSSQSVPALVSGQVQAVYAAYPSLVGFQKDGRVKIIGAASIKPSRLAPNVPAIGAQVPGYEYVHVIGLFAPTDIPKGVIKRLDKELTEMSKIPAIAEAYMPMGIEFEYTNLVDGQKHLQDEGEKIEKLVTSAKIKMQ